jgi:hypothetical protein
VLAKQHKALFDHDCSPFFSFFLFILKMESHELFTWDDLHDPPDLSLPSC